MTGVWDAVVIGGGPAGCSAAVTLARRGVRVLLVEAAQYPHEKVCGEFLSPESGPLLDDLLGRDRRVVDRGATLQQVRLTTVGGAVWESELPGAAVSLSRGVLDLELAEAAQRAGARVLTGMRVIALAGDLTKGFELRLQSKRSSERIRARAVVGAYGRRNRLDTQLSRPFKRVDQPYLGFKAHFSGPSLGDRIELHAFPGGYCGISDIEGGRQNVCMLVHRSAFAAANAGRSPSVDHLIDWIGRQNPALGERLQQAGQPRTRWLSIAQIPFGRKDPLAGDVLMAGDAAGVITPLAGDGIAMGLESGRLAGEMLSDSLAGRRSMDRLRRAYPAAWQRRFQRRLQFGRILQPLLIRPAAANAAVALIAAVPALGRFIIRNTRGTAAEPSEIASPAQLEVQEDR